jgi:hypothetical protein
MKYVADNIDIYGESEDKDKFDFLYSHFSRMRELLRDYKETLVEEILDIRVYNRRTADGELGVRVQESKGVSRPVETEAIAKSDIEKALEARYMSQALFNDINGHQDLMMRVVSYRRATYDFNKFKSKLMCLEVRERNFIKPYMEHEKNIHEVADEFDMDYSAVTKRISRTKARLWEMMKGEFRKKR